MAMSRRIGSELERSGRGWGQTGGNAPVLIGAVVLFTAIGLAAHYAPDLLTSLLVLGGLITLVVLATRASQARGLLPGPRRTDHEGPAAVRTAELVNRVDRLLDSFQHQVRIERIELLGQLAGSGLELIARDPRGQRMVIHCQSHALGEATGFLEMLWLLGAVIRARAASGIFVTTTSFTPAAITLAGYSPRTFFLYDGTALARVAARTEWAESAA